PGAFGGVAIPRLAPEWPQSSSDGGNHGVFLNRIDLRLLPSIGDVGSHRASRACPTPVWPAPMGDKPGSERRPPRGNVNPRPSRREPRAPPLGADVSRAAGAGRR